MIRKGSNRIGTNVEIRQFGSDESSIQAEYLRDGESRGPRLCWAIGLVLAN